MSSFSLRWLLVPPVPIFVNPNLGIRRRLGSIYPTPAQKLSNALEFIFGNLQRPLRSFLLSWIPADQHRTFLAQSLRELDKTREKKFALTSIESNAGRCLLC